MKSLCYIPILLALTWSHMLCAQSVVKHCPAFDNTNAIVRYWKSDISIAYVHTTGGTGFFLYEQNGSPIHSATTFPYGEVFDFEILGDTVYACGVTSAFSGGDHGIVAKFHINDLFFNGGDYGYSIIRESSFGCCARMTAPRRMDVYEENGVVHYALVGDMSSSDCGNYTDGATVEDIYPYDIPSTSPDVYQCNLQNKPNLEYYTDITATDSYVVAAARHHAGNACYLRIMDRTGNASFLGSPLTYGSIFEVVDDTPIGDILVEHITLDIFALAYHYTNASEAGLTVKIMKIAPSSQSLSVVYSCKLVQDTATVSLSPWTLHDLRYNSGINHLYLLQEMDYPLHAASTSTVLDFRLDNSNYSVLQCTADWISNTRLFSVDSYKGLGFHAMGRHSALPTLFFKKHQGAAASCCGEQDLPFKDNTAAVTISSVQTTEDNPYYHYSEGSLTPTLDHHAYGIECNN